MQTLAGKTALVTGVTGGIGPYIAWALARQRMKLVLAGRDASRLGEFAAQLRQQGHMAVSIPTDVIDCVAVRALVARTLHEFGSIDVLVTAAGVATLGAYHDLGWNEIAQSIHVNLQAPMLLTHLVLPAMLAQSSGHIVNIASLLGKSALAYQEAYCATKAGLILFTSALRASYHKQGVSASVICPGFIKQAGMFQRVMETTQVRYPAIVGASTPQQVARAIPRAIRRDLPEVIVNPIPVWPLMALQALSPGLAERLYLTLGLDVFKQAARVRDASMAGAAHSHFI